MGKVKRKTTTKAPAKSDVDEELEWNGPPLDAVSIAQLPVTLRAHHVIDSDMLNFYLSLNSPS